MSKLFNVFCLILFCTTAAATDRIYLDEEDIKATHDKFYVHQGHNVWLETNSLHRDNSGLFTFTFNLSSQISQEGKVEYVQKWKCPYCHYYWPIGTPCQNKDCPSRYK